MKFEYTNHAEAKILERRLKKKLVEDIIIKPDRILPSVSNRKIAQRSVNGRLLRVIYEETGEVYIIITAYYADIERYG